MTGTAKVPVEVIASASRLTASTDVDHGGAVDLRAPHPEPGRYHLRVAWRNPLDLFDPETGLRLGAGVIPFLDGVQWRLDGRAFASSPGDWAPWDDFGAFLYCPTFVDVPAGAHVVEAVLQVGKHRATVTGRFGDPDPVPPSPLVAALLEVDWPLELAALVERAATGGILEPAERAEVLDGLLDVSYATLPGDVFVTVAAVAYQLRRLERAEARAQVEAAERWRWALEGGSDG